MFGTNGEELPYENHGYEIGSMTKTFVGLMLAKYIHEGKMSLDDPISEYIDGLDASKYYPTLKRLVTHTSGYSGFPTSWDRAKTVLQYIFKGSANGGKLPFDMNLERMTEMLNESTVLAVDKQKKVACTFLSNYLLVDGLLTFGKSILNHLKES